MDKKNSFRKNLVEIRLLTANTYSFYDPSFVFKLVPFEVN